ncbi:hypothetical protein [Fusobacterium necrophorum]|uniref:hypothetical protein n=1 Tax=Fusobacterium necrophorum TaxID=859 RepID=UPI00370F7026
MLKNQKGYFIAALYLFGISQLAFAVESKEKNGCHGVDNDAVKGAAAYGCHNLLHRVEVRQSVVKIRLQGCTVRQSEKTIK